MEETELANCEPRDLDSDDEPPPPPFPTRRDFHGAILYKRGQRQTS